MKKPAHLIRGAFYLLLLFALYVIPFALAQRTTDKRSTAGNAMQLPTTSSDNGDQATGSVQVPQFPAGYLYYQYDNAATEPPLGIGSQQFEPAYGALTDQADDDFVLVNAPDRFVIFTVSVMGEYSAGGGPASSFNVFFYTNGNLYL